MLGKRFLLRFVLGGALLAGVATLAASCAEALDLEGRRDAFAEACDAVDRCFDGKYEACAARVENVTGFESALFDEWMKKAPVCIAGCSAVHRCLDYAGLCFYLGDPCTIPADCCGLTAGAATCEGGRCCAPRGADCTIASDCCDEGLDCINGRCGGVACAVPGELCLNDYLCCTGNCAESGGEKRCADAPCPPEGFACERDEDCCDLVCRDGRCAAPPTCALITETCTAELPCCDSSLTCAKSNPDAPEGLCTDDPTGCFPKNSDCFSDAQCCSKYCDPTFKICGECQSAGLPCGIASPCCASLTCQDGTCQAP